MVGVGSVAYQSRKVVQKGVFLKDFLEKSEKCVCFAFTYVYVLKKACSVPQILLTVYTCIFLTPTFPLSRSLTAFIYV